MTDPESITITADSSDPRWQQTIYPAKAWCNFSAAYWADKGASANPARIATNGHAHQLAI